MKKCPSSHRVFDRQQFRFLLRKFRIQEPVVPAIQVVAPVPISPTETSLSTVSIDTAILAFAQALPTHSSSLFAITAVFYHNK